MPASSLAIKNGKSMSPMMVLYLVSLEGISTTSLVQPLFLWLISKDSLTTQTTSIQPCSLPILSPKKACHFWTSSLASQTTESQLLSSTNLQMPTASSTMNHHIRRNAKTPSPTPSSAVSAVFVLMMTISIQKQRKCLPSLNKTTIQNTSLKQH